MRCLYAGLGAESVLVERVLMEAGWSSYSGKILGKRECDVLAESAASLRS